MSSLFKKRKVITWILLVVMVFQTLVMSLSQVNVYAENETANDRLSNSIKLAKGKTINDIDTSKLTDEELLLIGTYLSNFYIPMVTEVGGSTNEDTTEKAKDNMVTALVDGGGFNKDVAEALIETVWKMSVDSAQPLYIGRLKDDGTVDNKFGIHTNRDNDGEVAYGVNADEKYVNNDWREKNSNIKYAKKDIQELKATYFSFMDFFSGVANECSYAEEMTRTPQIKLSNKTICLYYVNNDGKRVPVFDTSFGQIDETQGNMGAQFTASSLVYGMLLDSLNYTKGIGSSLSGVESLKFYNNELNDEQRARVCALNARLYVDCFGNILVDYGTAKFVLVPACVNPYSWYTKEDKSDIGKNINLVNLFMLGEAESEHIKASDKKDKKEKKDNNSSNVIDTQYQFMMYHGKGSLFNLNLWRLYLGKTDTELDQNQKLFFAGWGLGDGATLHDTIKAYTREYGSGKNQQLFYSWSPYNSEFSLEDEDDYYDGSDKFDNLAFTKDEGHGVWSGYPVIRDSSGYATVNKKYSDNIIDDYILFNSYNTFKNAKDDDYSIFNLLNDGKGGIFLRSDDGEYKSIGGVNKGSNFGDYVDANNITTVSGENAKKYMAGIYCSYALAFYNDFSKDTEGKNTYVVNYAYNKDYFPAVSDVSVDWASVISSNMDGEIKSMIYYFLHPTEGISYVATWFKNKVSGILVKWHEDMVGVSDAKSTTGMTKYLGFSGYVTLPNLSDMAWTSWLLDEYNSLVVYLIIIIFVILIAYCIVGSMTFQRAIFGTLLFGLLAFFPPLCINATVNTINNTCDRLYGSKFTYWALVQHQTFIDELNEASNSETIDDYLVFIFRQSGEQLDTTNYARVRLKWTTPKKTDVTADVESELDNKTNNALVANLISGTVNQQLSGETFLDEENALYIYRDYADIYNYMIGGYNTEGWYNATATSPAELKIEDKDLRGYTNSNLVGKYDSGMKLWDIADLRYDNKYEFSQRFAKDKGFLTNTSDKDFYNRSYSYLLDSYAMPRILDNNEILLDGTISDDTTLRLVSSAEDGGGVYTFGGQEFGLSNEDFRTTLAKINGGVENGTDPNTSQPITVWSSDKSKFIKDDAGAFFFGMYTESPFYYFAYNILDQQSSDEFKDKLGISDGEISSEMMDLYTINNQQYFYNYNTESLNGFGELKDFSNMRGLFYYVIPYLRECNKGVLKWSDLYGTFTYDNVRVEYSEGVPTNYPKSSDTDEYVYKWWHNYNVERLFNTYSAWVDLMYSCDYAKSETINVLGEKYIVTDPLDPTSYFTTDNTGNINSGRMMVFSRSEMKYYGLTMNDLTKVEQKIIKVQDKVYEDLLQLMDYANFENDVLVTSAGMLTTFAFNQEFSQTTPIGENFTLYPQSYELKAFSYDAYLRLILAESTGEDLMNTDNNNSSNNGGQKSYYQRIVEKSSITTAIGLVILDIIAVYAIPALKLFFLIAIFFMSVLMIIAAAVKLEMNIVKTVWDALVFPLLKFGAVSIGLAWVVSLFMSDGNTDVTHRGGLTISLGDPSMVILIMIIINVVVLILYYKICKKCFKKAVEFAKAIGTSVGGALGGSLAKFAGLAVGGKAISDSVARGTAKARGKLNKPSATSTGVGGGSGKGSGKAGAFVAGAVAGKVADDVIDAKKKEKYDNLSKSQQSKVDKSNDKAKKAEEKYNKLSGNNDFDKATSYKDEADILRKQRNVAKLDREKHGRKATIGERAGDLKSYMTEKKLDLMSGIHSTKGSVRKGVNGKLGRTDRAMRKNIRSRQDASVRFSESTRRNKQNADYRAKRRRQDALHASRGKQKKKKGKK